MRVIAIIAEYNPFHKGHEYLIRRAREAVGDPRAIVLSIMSGPFTQRGLPACAPKSVRAKQALKCGSDVVLELPFEWACAPANEFAEGAVLTLMKTGVVTDIAFGVESDDPGIMEALSDPALYESESFTTALRDNLAAGMNFPKARAEAAASCLEGFDREAVKNCLHSPNSILAVEYLRAIKKFGAKFKVHMIKRVGQDYSSDDVNDTSGFMSASAVRKIISGCDSVSAIASGIAGKLPDKSAAVMLAGLSAGDFSPCDLDKYIIRAVTSPSDDISSVRFMGDGLDGHIRNTFEKLRSDDMSFEKVSSALYTKHFAMPRIYRALTMMMMDVKADAVPYEPRYIRVLGFSHEGRYCLKIMGKCAKLPIIHNQSDFLEHFSSDPDLKRSARLGLAADDLAGTFMGICPASAWDIPPVIVK